MEASSEDDTMSFSFATDDDVLSQLDDEQEEKFQLPEKLTADFRIHHGRGKPVSQIFPWLPEINKIMRLHLRTDHYHRSILPIMEQYLKCIQDDIANYIRFPNRCFILSKNITKMLLLFKDLNRNFNDTHEYLVKLCDLLSIYTTLELKYATKFEESKIVVANRISSNYDIHLQSFEKTYVLRIFISIRNFYQQNEVMCKLFEKYLKPKVYDVIQKEFSDKIYVMYLVAFKLWRSLEDDLDEKFKIDVIANLFMKPKSDLRRNLIYAPYIPACKVRNEDATKYILSQQFSVAKLITAIANDERRENYDIIGDIVDLSLSNDEPTFEVPNKRLASAISFPQIKLEQPEVVATIDLTSDGSSIIRETDLPWLDNLIQKTRANKIAALRTTIPEVILLDSDESDSETNDASPTTRESDKSPNDDPKTNDDILSITEREIDDIMEVFNENNREDEKSPVSSISSVEKSTMTLEMLAETNTNDATEKISIIVISEMLNPEENAQATVDEETLSTCRDEVKNVPDANMAESAISNPDVGTNTKIDTEVHDQTIEKIAQISSAENITLESKEDSIEAVTDTTKSRPSESKTETIADNVTSVDKDNQAMSPVECQVDNSQTLVPSTSDSSDDVLGSNSSDVLDRRKTQAEPMDSDEIKCSAITKTPLTDTNIETSETKVDELSPKSSDTVSSAIVNSKYDEIENRNPEDGFHDTIESELHPQITNLKTYSNRHRKINKEPAVLNNLPDFQQVERREFDTNKVRTESQNDDETNKPINFTANNHNPDLIITDSMVLNEKDIHKDSAIFLDSNNLQELCLMPDSPKAEEAVNSKLDKTESEKTTTVTTKSDDAIEARTELKSPAEKSKNSDDEEDDIIKNIAKKLTMNPKKRRRSVLPGISTIKPSHLSDCPMLDLPAFSSSSSDDNDDSSGDSNILSILDESDPAEDGNLRRLSISDQIGRLHGKHDHDKDDIPVDKITPKMDTNNLKPIESGNVIFSMSTNKRPPPIAVAATVTTTSDVRNESPAVLRSSMKESNVIFSTAVSGSAGIGSSQRKSFDHNNWIDPTLDFDENILNIHQNEITSPPMEEFTKSDKTLFKTYLNKPHDLSMVDTFLPKDLIVASRKNLIADGPKELTSSLKKKSTGNTNDSSQQSTRRTGDVVSIVNFLPSLQKRKTVSFVDIPPQTKISNSNRYLTKSPPPLTLQKTLKPAVRQPSPRECWTTAISTYKSNIGNISQLNSIQPSTVVATSSPSPSLQQSKIPSINTIKRRPSLHQQQQQEQPQPSSAKLLRASPAAPGPSENYQTKYVNKPWYDEKLFNAQLVLDKIEENMPRRPVISPLPVIKKPNTETIKQLDVIQKNLSEFDKYLQEKQFEERRAQAKSSTAVKFNMPSKVVFRNSPNVFRRNVPKAGKIRRCKSTDVPRKIQYRRTTTIANAGPPYGDQKLKKRCVLQLQDVAYDRRYARYFHVRRLQSKLMTKFESKNLPNRKIKPKTADRTAASSTTATNKTNTRNCFRLNNENNNKIILKPLRKKSPAAAAALKSRRNSMPEVVVNVYSCSDTAKVRSSSGNRNPSEVQEQVVSKTINVDSNQDDDKEINKTTIVAVSNDISGKNDLLIERSATLNTNTAVPIGVNATTDNVTYSAVPTLKVRNLPLENKSIESKADRLGYFINSYSNLTGPKTYLPLSSSIPSQRPTSTKQKRTIAIPDEVMPENDFNLTARNSNISRNSYSSLQSDNEVTSTQDSVTRSKSSTETPPIDTTVKPIDIQNNQIDTSTKDDLTAAPRPANRRGRKPKFQNSNQASSSLPPPSPLPLSISPSPAIASTATYAIEGSVEQVTTEISENSKPEDTNIPTTTTMIADRPTRKRAASKRKSSNAKRKRQPNKSRTRKKKIVSISSSISSCSRESDNEPLVNIQKRLTTSTTKSTTDSGTDGNQATSSAAGPLPATVQSATPPRKTLKRASAGQTVKTKTYSKRNFIKNVFVPPEIEKIIEEEEKS